MVGQTKIKTGKKEGVNNTGKGKDWKVNGWISVSKDGKTGYVRKGEGEDGKLIGFYSLKLLERFINDKIRGVPIKIPPSS